jgi:CHAP domain
MTTADVQNFMNTWMNRFLDTDGYPSYWKYQCVDVFRKYQTDVVGNPLVPGNARDYWYNYPRDPVLQQFYVRIPNTLTAIPKMGDVIIWDGWSADPYGHIAICTAAAGMIYFTSFDQNWPLRSPCHYQVHNFYPWSPKVLGWLRPKALV